MLLRIRFDVPAAARSETGSRVQFWNSVAEVSSEREGAKEAESGGRKDERARYSVSGERARADAARGTEAAFRQEFPRRLRSKIAEVLAGSKVDQRPSTVDQPRSERSLAEAVESIRVSYLAVNYGSIEFVYLVKVATKLLASSGFTASMFLPIAQTLAIDGARELLTDLIGEEAVDVLSSTAEATPDDSAELGLDGGSGDGDAPTGTKSRMGRIAERAAQSSLVGFTVVLVLVTLWLLKTATDDSSGYRADLLKAVETVINKQIADANRASSSDSDILKARLELLKTDSTERTALTNLLVAIVADRRTEAKATSTAGDPTLVIMPSAWSCCVPPRPSPVRITPVVRHPCSCPQSTASQSTASH